MKKIFLIISICCFISCDNQQIEDNTRVVVKGRLVDENGQPLTNELVEIFSDYSRNSSLDDLLLGSGRTKADGSFSITSLFDAQNNFLVLIDQNAEYSIYQYVTSEIDLPNIDNTIDLGPISQVPKKEVNVKFVSLDNSNESIVYEVVYTFAGCFVSSENGNASPRFENCFPILNNTRVLNPASGNDSFNLSAVANSEITITYRVGIDSTDEITETFNSQNSNYVIEF